MHVDDRIKELAEEVKCEVQNVWDENDEKPQVIDVSSIEFDDKKEFKNAIAHLEFNGNKPYKVKNMDYDNRTITVIKLFNA